MHAQFEVVIHKWLSLTIGVIGEIVIKKVTERNITFISQKQKIMKSSINVLLDIMIWLMNFSSRKNVKREFKS